MLNFNPNRSFAVNAASSIAINLLAYIHWKCVYEYEWIRIATFSNKVDNLSCIELFMNTVESSLSIRFLAECKCSLLD